MPVKFITVTDLQAKLNHQEDLVLLDVREPHEVAYASIQGSVTMPMQQIPQRLAELNRDKVYAVICHHGMRSMQVAEYLVASGYEQVFNVTGGIDAWSRTCDAAVLRY